MTGSRAPKPRESRRWLKPRVRKKQLYRLAPQRPKLRRLGSADFWDRARRLLRAWWIWAALAVYGYEAERWKFALIAAAVAFIFYHASPGPHPAFYALSPNLDAGSSEFRTTMAGLTGASWIKGNRLAIYNNGDEFYPAMLDAIDKAQHSVTMEQYIFWDGDVGQRFAEAFAEKAREGVPVKLLVDSIGSSEIGEPILKLLQAGGCQLAWFRPIRWYTLDRANYRTHRKSLIIDGHTAFTGGAGIGDHWLGNARNEKEWREIQICVEGPSAIVLQAGFAQNWLLTTGEVLSGHVFFPEPRTAGNVEVQTINSSPAAVAGATGTMHLVALQCARKYLYIANPYFIPDSRMIEILGDAHRRGVEIKVMVSGEHNDSWWARQNSLRFYEKLLKAGVEIYEYRQTMLHQKTMVVDGVWATVGTSNFDNRSFALSEETDVCFQDPALMERLREIFAADLVCCKKISLAEWRRRSVWQRAQEAAASLIEDQV